MGLYRRLLHAIDNHGVRGLFVRALAKLTPRANPNPEFTFNESGAPHPFDLAHRVETSGHIPGEQLGGNSPSDLYSTAYYGISPSTLTDALRRLPESAAGFTFVDLGCGKGRALRVAAQFPFSGILGVELSAELCQVAAKNCSADPRIAIQQHDAATVTLPHGPLVVYFYHPFLKPVLRRVLSNLQHQRQHSADATYLLYANCRYEDVMAKYPFLQVIWDYSLPLSPEDAAADRHRITHERFTLYRAS